MGRADPEARRRTIEAIIYIATFGRVWRPRICLALDVIHIAAGYD
jgi:hypothetical protein